MLSVVHFVSKNLLIYFVVMVVGEPINVKKAVSNPSNEQVQRLHKKYIQGLVKVFEANKHRYGIDKSVKLTIV